MYTRFISHLVIPSFDKYKTMWSLYAELVILSVGPTIRFPRILKIAFLHCFL